MDKFPKLYHPDHRENTNQDVLARKTLTPRSQAELESLLRLGWQIAPDDFLTVPK